MVIGAIWWLFKNLNARPWVLCIIFPWIREGVSPLAVVVIYYFVFPTKPNKCYTPAMNNMHVFICLSSCWLSTYTKYHNYCTLSSSLYTLKTLSWDCRSFSSPIFLPNPPYRLILTPKCQSKIYPKQHKTNHPNSTTHWRTCASLMVDVIVLMAFFQVMLV